MAIVTFLSDLGVKDHYTTAFKAAVLSQLPDTQIIDISHQIPKHDIAHAAYVLDAVFRDFPEGTVHVVAVQSTDFKPVAVLLEGHYFICPDNGILSLVSEQKPAKIVALPTENTTFPEKNSYAPAAIRLIKEGTLEQIGTPLEELNRLLNWEVRVSDNMMVGHVIHVDDYGNLVTNISHDLLDRVVQGRPFTIKVSREYFSKIQQTYDEVAEGECVIVFNNRGFLEVAINKGNASALMGLEHNSSIIIYF